MRKGRILKTFNRERKDLLKVILIHLLLKWGVISLITKISKVSSISLQLTQRSIDNFYNKFQRLRENKRVLLLFDHKVKPHWLRKKSKFQEGNSWRKNMIN